MGQTHAFPDERPGADHDADFVALQAAFRRSGGLARGDWLACAMHALPHGDALSLDRLIVSDRVFSFDWNGAVWVPRFQLDSHDLTPRREPLQVLAELRPICDGWTLARWYAMPNRWLADRAPIDLLDTEPARVLLAARAVREGCRAAEAIGAPWH